MKDGNAERGQKGAWSREMKKQKKMHDKSNM
jgi:hypothetical protein